MDNSETDANGNLKRIYSQDKLLDVLIEFERILDSLDIYAFENWIDAEVVSGPHFHRYWIEVILKYEGDSKPDPMGAERLQQQGIKIKYEKSTETVPIELASVENQEDAYEGGERKTKKKRIWLLHMKMPRHLITDIDAGQLETDDEIIDLDDVRDAEESGVDDQIVQDDQKDEALDDEEEGKMDEFQ